MSSSLQEQLVQAGLADEESLDRSRQRGRRQAGGKRKGGKTRSGGRIARQTKQPTSGRNDDAAAPQTKKHGTKPPAAEREPTTAEKADRLRQMIRANRIDRAYAGVPYRFTQESRVREVAVTGTQQGRIARGELAIVSDGERIELVPAKVARRVRGIDPNAVLVLNGGDESGPDTGDDPYAEYRVPDDLMW